MSRTANKDTKITHTELISSPFTQNQCRLVAYSGETSHEKNVSHCAFYPLHARDRLDLENLSSEYQQPRQLVFTTPDKNRQTKPLPRNYIVSQIQHHDTFAAEFREMSSIYSIPTTYITQYGQIAALPRTNRTICRTAIRTASALFCPQPEQAGAPLEAKQKNAVALCRRRGDWLCRHAQHTRQHLRQPHQLLRNE